MEPLKRLTHFFSQKMVQHDPSLTWSELSVLFCDDEAITQLKQQYFGLNEATDVISFRYDPLPGETGLTGEVIINVEQALRIGPQHDGIPSELALYLAHGCDHLTGAEDKTDEGRRQMHDRDRAWVAAAAEAGLLNELVEATG